MTTKHQQHQHHFRTFDLAILQYVVPIDCAPRNNRRKNISEYTIPVSTNLSYLISYYYFHEVTQWFLPLFPCFKHYCAWPESGTRIKCREEQRLVLGADIFALLLLPHAFHCSQP